MAQSKNDTAPRFSELTRADNMVTVKIGPEQTTYRIHKALLEHHSDYFRNALHQCWKEGDERQVVLDNVEPAAFDVFVDWLYTNKIPKEDAKWSERDADEVYWQYVCRVNVLRLQAYALADRLGVQELLRTINNNYVDENICVNPYYEEIIYAFSNIPSGRPILKLMVASHCAFSRSEDDVHHPEQEGLRSKLPHEFLLQISRLYQEICEATICEDVLNACDYHEHVSRAEKKKCGKAGKA